MPHALWEGRDDTCAYHRLEVQGFIRNGKASRLHEIGCDHSSDVRDGEIFSCEIWRRAQPLVENPNDLGHSWLIRFGPGRDLGNFEMSHGRMRVPEVLSHWQEEIELGAPVPHLDHADLDRRLAEKGRVRLNRFEIAADRHAL